jgi:hypothetical protein
MAGLAALTPHTPERHDLGDGKKPLKGEMWFAVPDQPVFAVAGFWQATEAGNSFAMVLRSERAGRAHSSQGSYDDVVKLQRPFDADRMTVRGPIFPTRRNER